MILINDHFQNKKQYNIPPAQLVIADIPYNVGKDAYGSNPKWYVRKNLFRQARGFPKEFVG